jgi:uncharacterized protein YjbI with pentapeptide repeats
VVLVGGRRANDGRNIISRLERSSRYLLAALGALTVLTVWFMADKDLNKYAFATIPLLGVVIVLGCLFAFPQASVWETGDLPNPQLVNDIRTMLVSTVVGALTLSTLYLTYQSTRAAADSAETSRKSLESDQISHMGDLLGNPDAVVRATGIYALRTMMSKNEFDRTESYRLLAAHVRTHSKWPKEKRQRWPLMTDEQRRASRASAQFGLGSLRKRAYDVQVALDALSQGSKNELPLLQNGRPYRADLRDADLQGAEFGLAQLQHAIFSGAHLDYMDCRTSHGHADFQDADFQGASLYGTWLTRADLTRAVLNTPEEADGNRRLHQITILRDANLDDAILVGTDFQGADLTGASLRRANLTNAKLNTPRNPLTERRVEPITQLTSAHLDGANLTGANLEAANLSDAWLAGAQLTNARLAEASLLRAHLDGANLTGANLEAANLSDAWLAGAQLTNARLAEANLSSAHLRGSNLAGLNLQDVDLRGAWLADAQFAGTNLTGADLSGAHLEGADLSSSVGLDKAVLDGASYSEATNWPENFWVSGSLVYVDSHPATSAELLPVLRRRSHETE